jgi:LysR family transcriptional regulator, glycine cleavage system transcriptional activator
MLRRQLPSTNSLFTFEVVARLGSFSGAAKELNVTQPAVSRSISVLEMHLGYPLFKRHGRWIELTPNGDKLFRATSTAFKTVIDALREIGQQNESREGVTISMSSTAINYWFIPRLADFRANFPSVSLDFQMYSADGDDLVRGVDLCIRLSYPKDANLHRWSFSDERIMALCSPDYIRENGTLDWQIKGRIHTLIEGVDQRYSMDEFFHATGHQFPKVHASLKFSDYSSIIQAAIRGQGIALAWVPETSRLVIEGNLVPVCAQVVKTGRRYHILASNLTPMRPVVEDIRDWLISEMRGDQKKVTAVMRASPNRVNY